MCWRGWGGVLLSIIRERKRRDGIGSWGNLFINGGKVFGVGHRYMSWLGIRVVVGVLGTPGNWLGWWVVGFVGGVQFFHYVSARHYTFTHFHIYYLVYYIAELYITPSTKPLTKSTSYCH